MRSFPSNIPMLYKRLLCCWCCSLEILYVSLPPFWGPGMLHYSIPIFVFLQKIYLPPPHRASTSLFSSGSTRVLMVLTVSKTLPVLKHSIFLQGVSNSWMNSCSLGEIWSHRARLVEGVKDVDCNCRVSLASLMGNMRFLVIWGQMGLIVTKRRSVWLSASQWGSVHNLYTSIWISTKAF